MIFTKYLLPAYYDVVWGFLDFSSRSEESLFIFSNLLLSSAASCNSHSTDCEDAEASNNGKGIEARCGRFGTLLSSLFGGKHVPVNIDGVNDLFSIVTDAIGKVFGTLTDWLE